MNDRFIDLYDLIENEGFYYYFAHYGPEPADEVPEEIRELWAEATALAKDLSRVEYDLMAKLEAAYDS